MDQPFSAGEALIRFAEQHSASGAICSFVGDVRGGDGIEALELSHYAPLTLAGIEDLASRVAERFGLLGILILHRVGEMAPGEPIVCVSAAASHRRAAFDAVDYAMDHLKSRAWFWKRERRGGQWTWIEPRDADYSDAQRWD